jgi:hypothetical protein
MPSFSVVIGDVVADFQPGFGQTRESRLKASFCLPPALPKRLAIAASYCALESCAWMTLRTR